MIESGTYDCDCKGVAFRALKELLYQTLLEWPSNTVIHNKGMLKK